MTTIPSRFMNGAGGTVTATNLMVTAPYGNFFKTNIINAGVDVNSKILINWGAFADIQTNCPDPSINFKVQPGDGSFDLTMESINNQVFGGPFFFNYLIL